MSPLLVCSDPAVDAQQLDQQADERRDTLQAAAAPAELGAAGANEWGSNAKTEVARILVGVRFRSGPAAELPPRMRRAKQPRGSQWRSV